MSFQTMMPRRHKVVGGVGTQNGGAPSHMAPLIRAPVMSIPMATGFKGSKILESSMKSQKKSPKPNGHRGPSQSKLGFNAATNETRRREKLRAVLAMMGGSTNKALKNRRASMLKKQESSISEDQDSLAALRSDPRGPRTSMLTVANLNPGTSRRSGRRMSIVSDSTQSSHRGRRGAILQGKLPVRSFPDDESEAKKIAEEIGKKKEKPKFKIRGGKFRVVSKLIVLLIRFARNYILTESDERMIRLFSAIDAANAGDQYKIKSDLIFDVATFKADRQYRVSSDTKRILAKPSEKRTEEEITHVQVELQPLKFVKRYPVSMQRNMIQAGWYEEFTPGRVITRYNKTPSAFYLILGGSALVLEGDPNNSGREATPAERGDVFGNDAIASRTRHKFSVISKEHIHLLCLSVEDYSRIFLAGGLQNFSDVDDGSFISSVFLFDNWPIHLLKDNPKMVKFNYYTQGTVIVEDSDRSEWIYIIKSGSASILKLFHDNQDIHAMSGPAKKRKKIANAQKYSRVVSHEQKLSFKLQELQRKRAKRMKGQWRKDVWKDNLLRVPLVNDPLMDSIEDHQISTETRLVNIMSTSSIYDVDKQEMSPRETKETKMDEAEVVSSAEPSSSLQPVAVNSNGQGGKLLPYQRIKLAKGPYLTHKPCTQTVKEVSPKKGGKQASNATAAAKHSSNASVADKADIGLNSSSDEKEESSNEYDDHEVKRPKKSKKAKKQPTFVQIDTLEKGDIFGILDVAFGNQLSHLSLVSNGVECIEINKRFYLKHAPESIKDTIIEKMRPYANEDTLTKDLQEKLTWKDHRQSTLKNTARQFKRYRKMVADPRLPRLGLIPDL